MLLEPGTRLGHYTVERQLGHGGMGTVYAARDTRLDRTVAIKMLHHEWTGAEQRFSREAHAIAALQHPHICALHDVGSHEGVRFLVMEHLEGMPLRGPLPIRQVLQYGRQIADALAAAHARGIVHRDLKPANVMVTKSGVKVLDFGIARMDGDVTVTIPGAVIGTPAYMAPEQRTGASTDSRTDIYALGRLLVEMATGRNDPGQSTGHPALDAIVEGCLAEDPDERWQSAADVRRLLQRVDLAPPADRPRSMRRSWLLPAGALLVVAAAASAWVLSRSASAAATVHASIAPPPGSTFVLSINREGGVALSPDGTHLVFVARTGGHVRLWLRRLDSPDAHPLPGTDRAFNPFWSPDSREVAFFTPDSLRIVPIDGGPVRTVCPTDPRAEGGAWLAGSVLLITGRPGGGIHRVSSGGGESERVLDGSWPYALPGGQSFVYSEGGALHAASIASPADAERLTAASFGQVAYSRGHLLFVRGRTLVAQPFDLRTLSLSGQPFTVAERLLSYAPLIPWSPVTFSAGGDGTLVYAAGDPLNQFTWRDRRGGVLGTLAGEGVHQSARISPDGTRVVFARSQGDNMDVWVTAVPSGEPSRLTFGPERDDHAIWSRDGKTIVYQSGTTAGTHIVSKPADGSGEPHRLTSEPGTYAPNDWSSDGEHLAFTTTTLATASGSDLTIWSRSGATGYDFLKTSVSEAHPQFAPGSPPRWIAYTSDDTGRREVYVTPFAPGRPASQVRWQISPDGGTMPRWRADGRELFYWALDGRIMAVAVDASGPAFRWSAPVTLFEVRTPTLRTVAIEFDVTPDGQRFLVLEPSEQTRFRPLSLVTNWNPRR